MNVLDLDNEAAWDEFVDFIMRQDESTDIDHSSLVVGLADGLGRHRSGYWPWGNCAIGDFAEDNGYNRTAEAQRLSTLLHETSADEGTLIHDVLEELGNGSVDTYGELQQLIKEY